MHILFDARSALSHNAGLSLYCRSVLEAFTPLLEHDERITVVVPHHMRMADTVHTVHAKNYRIRRAHYSHMSLRGYLEIGHIAHRLKPDLFWSPNPLTTFRIATTRLLTVQDYRPFTRHDWGTWLQRLFWNRFAGSHIRHAHRIICATETIRQACIERFGPSVQNTATTIYSGVNSQYTPQSNEAIQRVRTRYRLPAKFFLFLGEDKPHKNLSTLLRTLQGMDETACLPLVVAGPRSDTPERRREVRQLRLDYRVKFIGEAAAEDMPALYSAAYILLLPSLNEGFSQTLLQSMSCGTPVICSAIPSLCELGASATLRVHPTDIHEWKRAITVALYSPLWREQYRAKSLEHATHFTWQVTARQTLNICRQLVLK